VSGQGLALARLEELADPCALVVHAGEIALVLTRAGDRISAFRNRCPHAGYPLQRHDGRIVVHEGRYIVCGAHGASFSFDGACAGGPCNGDSLEPVAIVVRDGQVWMA
jgi:nitrite reductase/ring-hydroxylating ferredoxin subunit